MRIFSYLRAMLFVLFLCVIPASASAGVFISVGFAPPVLPVYVQPPCPEPGWMWTPGYWAYGPDGYYWVEGTWVPAPYIGALWTPPYWGWDGGLFVFHTGYWGPHVGYYGGVNYGFGYMGVGFAGGAWHGRDFAYNTAVVNVNRSVIHNTYVDNTVVRNNTVVNNRVAYSGGPGGVNHQPTAQENSYSHEQHMAATSMQSQHESAAMHNTNNYASHNGGHPSNAAMERPAGGNVHGAGNAPRNNVGGNEHGANNAPRNNVSGNEHGANNAPRNHAGGGMTPSEHNSTHANTYNGSQHPGGAQPSHQAYESHQAPPQHEMRQAPQPHEMQQAPQAHEMQQAPHPAPQPRQAPQSHQAPQPRGNEHGHR